MMNEDFAPFELAVKLNEKGFREKCLLHYDSTGGFYSNIIDTCYRPHSELDYSDFLRCFNEGNSIGLVDAPTISQVLKWLREEKKIYIVIAANPTLSTKDKIAYYYQVYSNSNGVTSDYYESEECYAQWEECAIDSIKYVLDNLI